MIVILVKIIAFVIAIGVLVAVHEFGHFWVARRLGIRVLRFSIGFGRAIWMRKGRDDVEYVIAAIPLGGYVKLLDEREAPVAAQDLPFAFNRAPVWKRIAVLLAGVTFNFIFAILAYWILFMAGVPGMKPVVGPVERNSLAANAGLRANDRIDAVAGQPVATQEAAMLAILEDMIDDGKIHLRVAQLNEGERDLMIDVGDQRNSLTQPDALLSGLGFDFWSPPAIVGRVAPGSSAERAGLVAGDKISSIDGKPVESFLDMVRIVRARPDQNAVLAIQRADEHRDVAVHIAAEGSGDQRHGMIGIESVKPPQALGALQKYGPLAALGQGAKKTWETSAFTLRIFGNILTGHVSLKNISGPISIAEYTGMAAIAGWLPYLTMLALISISLGVLNLLPVPILDGGQIVYQLAELIKGSPVSEQAQLRGQQVGIVLLLLLMTLAFYNDIARHLG